MGSVRSAVRSYLKVGEEIVEVKISQSEGNKVYGFVKVRNRGEHQYSLFDFKATSTPQGGLSFLEVNGRKI